MQNSEQIFREEMAKHDLRVTDNRLAIFRVLAESKRSLSIKEIIEISKSEGYFTSVYRSIEAMSRVGILRVVPRGFKNLYELGEKFKPHHHHATCEKCGKSIAIDDPRIERLFHELTMKSGLKPTEHHFEIFGICRKCRNS